MKKNRKVLFNIKCLFWFALQLLSEKFFILRRTERDVIKNVYWSSCKVHIIFVRFWWNLNFLNRYSKSTQISNLMEVRPMGAELFHEYRRTDGRTDITKLTVAFRNFANEPKKLNTCTFFRHSLQCWSSYFWDHKLYTGVSFLYHLMTCYFIWYHRKLLTLKVVYFPVISFCILSKFFFVANLILWKYYGIFIQDFSYVHLYI